MEVVKEPAFSNELVEWWLRVANDDIVPTAEKMSQYGGHNGSADFEIMAKSMQVINPELPDKVALEMAVAFYLMGKVARMFAAYAHGILPSEDTLHDTTVYSMILRRIREVGTWG